MSPSSSLVWSSTTIRMKASLASIVGRTLSSDIWLASKCLSLATSAMTSSWAFRNVAEPCLNRPSASLPGPISSRPSSWVSSVCSAPWAPSNLAFQVSCSALSPAARASSIICSAMYMRSGSAWARSASRIRRTVFSPV